jgi:hypothetical protein
MANFKQLQISGRGFDQIDRQRVGRPIVCRFASRLERIEMFPNIDIGKSVVHFAPCAPHLFNVFSPNIAPRISVPVASLGHFRFYGPSVEVNFTSLYLWVFMGLLDFSFTRSVPFLQWGPTATGVRRQTQVAAETLEADVGKLRCRDGNEIHRIPEKSDVRDDHLKL